MKREILCIECAGKMHRRLISDNPYLGEYVKFVHGNAKGGYRCDLCGGDIETGKLCCAFTIYTNRTPYFAWEGEFISIEKASPAATSEAVK